MAGKNLFDLTTRMLELEGILSNFDGDITDADKEEAIDALFAELAENEDELGDKIDDYIYVIAEFEGRAEIRAREAIRMAALADKDEANGKRLRTRLKTFLEVTGREKFQSKLHSLSVSNAGGKLGLEVDITVDELHGDSFKKEVPAVFVLDNDAVRHYLENNEEGLAWARFKPRSKVLKIK